MEPVFLKISQYLKTIPISKESLALRYETSGYRCEASLLNGVSARIGLYACLRSIVKNGRAMGVMITASHNPHQDNGIKLIEVDGSMIPTACEASLVDFVRSSPADLLSWMQNNLPKGTDFSLKPQLFIGWDTRPSSEPIADEIIRSAAVLDCDCTNFSLVTTPQLHFLVQIQSKSSTKPDQMIDYNKFFAQRLAFCFSHLGRGSEEGNNGHCVEVTLNIDCAHGVGGLVVTSLAAHLHLEFRKPSYDRHAPRLSLIPFNTRTNEKDKLNHNCGADYVKLTSRCPEISPSEDFVDAFHIGSRWATIDGDGDRLLYFFPTEDQGGISLLDGDRIACLFCTFIREQLKMANPSPKLVVGAVQTAFANAASTRYLRDEIGVEVVCTLSGVKHLHREAQKFDFGVYFEANGHGTVLLSAKATAFVEGLPTSHPLQCFYSLLNTAIGDSITDILLVEYVLQYRKLSLEQWFSCYTDLPSRQLKVVVVDRNLLKTTDADRRLLSPKVLQTEIDTVVSEVDTAKGTPGASRAFVRVSGTENIVRVYAESSTQPLTDWLANKVAHLVFKHANGVPPAPVFLGPMP